MLDFIAKCTKFNLGYAQLQILPGIRLQSNPYSPAA